MSKKEIDCCFAAEGKWFRYRTGAIIVEDNAVLFAGNENFDYLYTVGGGVHMGEKAEECIQREVYEETGVAYEVERLAVICENFFTGHGPGLEGFDCHCLEFYFLMKSKGSRELNSHSLTWDNRQEEMYWVPIEEIENYNIKPSFLKERIKDIVNGSEVLHIVTDKDREV